MLGSHCDTGDVLDLVIQEESQKYADDAIQEAKDISKNGCGDNPFEF